MGLLENEAHQLPGTIHVRGDLRRAIPLQAHFDDATVDGIETAHEQFQLFQHRDRVVGRRLAGQHGGIEAEPVVCIDRLDLAIHGAARGLLAFGLVEKLVHGHGDEQPPEVAALLEHATVGRAKRSCDDTGRRLRAEARALPDSRLRPVAIRRSNSDGTARAALIAFLPACYQPLRLLIHAPPSAPP